MINSVNNTETAFEAYLKQFTKFYQEKSTFWKMIFIQPFIVLCVRKLVACIVRPSEKIFQASRAIEISLNLPCKQPYFRSYGSKRDGVKSIFVENYLLHQNYIGFIAGLAPITVYWLLILLVFLLILLIYWLLIFWPKISKKPVKICTR